MHLAAKHGHGDGAADHRRRDVVEKARQHEDHHQQYETALPVIGQKFRQPRRYLAFFKVLGQYRKAEQQAEQVGENHPLVREVQAEARDAVAGLEAGHQQLVGDDGGQPDQRHAQRVAVKQCHTQQRQREQDEIDRYAEHRRAFAASGACQRRHCHHRGAQTYSLK